MFNIESQGTEIANLDFTQRDKLRSLWKTAEKSIKNLNKCYLIKSNGYLNSPKSTLSVSLTQELSLALGLAQINSKSHRTEIETFRRFLFLLNFSLNRKPGQKRK